MYEELSTVVLSSTSLLPTAVQPPQTKPKSVPPVAPKSTKDAPSKTKEKGTDHLKKRDDKPKPDASENGTETSGDATDASSAPPLPLLDEALVRLAKLCLNFDKPALSEWLEQTPAIASTLLGPEYFRDDARFAKLEEPIGLVGVSTVAGLPDAVEWLLDHGADPAIGASPYLATKHKGVRMTLRKYWAAYPDKYNYAAAGVPSPLTQEDLDTMLERERAKRKKEKLKKKEKTQAKVDAAKTPEQRARELRAAAAEARLLGNRCAACKKSLVGKVPFERLAYKYCSVKCVDKHRKDLNEMTPR